MRDRPEAGVLELCTKTVKNFLLITLMAGTWFEKPAPSHSRDTDSPSAEHQRSTPSIRQVRGNVDQEAGWDSKMRQKMSNGVDTRSLEEVI